jgi:hypothetical protein
MRFKLFIFTLLALSAVSCTREILPEPAQAEEEGKMVTISATIPQETRVAYNDATLKLAWEKNDKLLLAGYDAGGVYKGSSTFTYLNGSGNRFNGTPVPNATTYKAYYPATVTLDANGNMQPVANTFWQQTQSGNNSTAHLSGKLIMNDEIANDLTQPFDLVLRNDIIRFNLSNLSGDLGALKKLIWTVETVAGGASRSVILNINGYTHTAGTNITAYLAFDPAVMTIAAGGKVKITLIGDKSYEWNKTINNNVTYQPGNRYYTSVSGVWSEVVPLLYTIQTYQDNKSHGIWQKEATNSPAYLTIYWGDGSANTTIAQGAALNQNIASHIYTGKGKYTVTIISNQANISNKQMPQFTFNKNITGEDLLTSVLSPFPNMDAENFTLCFRSCSQLTSIPAELFRYNTQATDFSDCFNGCTKLISIPAGLFDNNSNVTNFSSCFRGCSKLVSIPVGLFNNNTQAINFSWCFSGCGQLQLIPEIFPDPNTNADFFAGKTMNFLECFKNVGSSYTTSTGTAPALWSFNKGGATWTTTGCFTNANVTNSGNIPPGWQ